LPPRSGGSGRGVRWSEIYWGMEVQDDGRVGESRGKGRSMSMSSEARATKYLRRIATSVDDNKRLVDWCCGLANVKMVAHVVRHVARAQHGEYGGWWKPWNEQERRLNLGGRGE
jgi:hypothetical protein